MKTRVFGALAVSSVLALFIACSSDDTSNNPGPLPTPDGGNGGSGGSIIGDENTVPSPDASGGSGGAVVTEAGVDGSGGSSVHPEAGSCVREAGACSPCAPSTQEEFKNGCTATKCVPFTTALPLLKSDGTLPPIP